MMSRKMYALSRYTQPIPICFIYQTNNPLYRSVIFSGDTSGPCNSQGAYGSAWWTDRRLALLRLSTRKKELYSEEATETKKSREKEKWNPKRRCKKKRTGESGVIKGMGAQYRKAGEGGNAVLCLFFFACASPFLLLYIG